MSVLRANESWPRVCQLNFSAEHIEARHRAGFEPPGGVSKLLGQELDRGFLHDDLLRRHQDVVIGNAHFGQRVGDHGLVVVNGLLFGQSGRFQRRPDAPPLKDRLNQTDAG